MKGMKKEMSKEEVRRRLRLQLAMPGPVVLLATLLFWSLGGGGGSEKEAAASVKPGLNVSVPAASSPQGRMVDKLALYAKAKLDSLKMAEQAKAQAGRFSTSWDSLGVRRWGMDSNEAKVNARLAELKAALRTQPASGMGSPGSRGGFEGSPVRMGSPGLHSPDVERLERLMTVMKGSGSAGSPEMQELNRTLDKLIAVQQPGRHRDGGGTDGGAGDSLVAAALPVHTVVAEEAVSGSKPSGSGGNRFYDLESSSGEEEPMGTAIEAIVPETQTLVNGAVMRLELATELVIRGQRVAKGLPLYGNVRLSNERLLVTISSIRCHDQVYPVALRVLDQDGLAGIYSPGSINRDVARESAGENIAGASPAGLDATLGGQAANAGIQLARNLVSRKVRLIRVTVKAGYRVFLQDESRSH